MAVITFDDVQYKQEGGAAVLVGTVNSATAADTIDITTYLKGREIMNVSGANVTDAVSLTYTYDTSNVITVPAGPSTDKISIEVTLKA